MPRTAAKLAKIVHLAAELPADEVLIERFLDGDSSALESIVRRHGPTVLGVCRRVLGSSADADDAFQATFLTFALRARSIRNPAVLNSWLHGVALRCSRKALGRRARKPLGDAAGASDPFAEVSWRELRGLLDEELNRLPDNLRAPLILCHLESRTRDEAARSLGWSMRTLDRRLAKGRELLKARLVRRGVATLGLGACVLGSDGLTASVPDDLLASVCQSNNNVSPSVSSLITTASTGFRFHIAASIIAVLGGLAAVAGFGGSPPVDKQRERPPQKAEVAIDLEEPMPEGAVRRFGSTRYRYPGGYAHAAMTRDGKLVAIGGYGVVLIYDTATGKRIRTLDYAGMTNAVGRLPAISFSPDGKLLAHNVRDGEIVARVWNVETGKEVSHVDGLRPTPHTGLPGFQPAGVPSLDTEFDHFTAIQFMDDGKHFAIIGDRKINIRSAATGAKFIVYDMPTIEVEATGKPDVPKPDRPSEAVPAADVPVSGTRSTQATLLALSSDLRLYVIYNGADWQVGELASKKVLFKTTSKLAVPKGRRWVNAFAAISPDGKLVAIPRENLDGVTVWDIATKRLVQTLTSKDAKVALIDHMSFSSDGKQLFAGGENIVYRWDVATGVMLPALAENTGYGPPRTFTDADAKSLVTVDDNGRVHRWDQATGKQLDSPHGYAPYTLTDLSSDGEHAVIADGTGRIDLWTLRDNERHELHPSGSPRARDVRFSLSSKLLAAGFDDGTIRVWSTATRKEIKRFRANPTEQSSGIEALAWSPDESCLYATTPLNGVLAWKWRTSELCWNTTTAHVTKICASIDGKLVAALRVEHWEIQILNAATGKVQATVRKLADKDRHSAPECIVFSPDGKTLLAGHYDGLVRIWDSATGKLRAGHQSDGDVMWGIDVSRDGRHAVTGSSNGTVRVWELDTGKEVFRRAEPRSSSIRVKYASDHRTVFSAQQRAPLIWSLVANPKGDREQHWSDLLSEPATAYRAQWGLADSENLARFLREKIGGKVPLSEAKRIEQLVADLDDDSFRKRETAATELVQLGRLAESAIRGALTKSPSVEQKQRLESLVARLDKGMPADELRMRRAIQALTWSSDPDVKNLLEEWASGMSGAPLTVTAKSALDSLK